MAGKCKKVGRKSLISLKGKFKKVERKSGGDRMEKTRRL